MKSALKHNTRQHVKRVITKMKEKEKKNVCNHKASVNKSDIEIYNKDIDEKSSLI